MTYCFGCFAARCPNFNCDTIKLKNSPTKKHPRIPKFLHWKRVVSLKKYTRRLAIKCLYDSTSLWMPGVMTPAQWQPSRLWHRQWKSTAGNRFLYFCQNLPIVWECTKLPIIQLQLCRRRYLTILCTSRQIGTFCLRIHWVWKSFL
jgi:hypothetical protein